MIAVAPSGRQVWVQTAVQSVRNGEGVPARFRSPTWAVNLAGRRVSPVLQLPLGLVAATESGPLTQNLATGQLQLWNGATGRQIPLNLPANAAFLAARPDRLGWQSHPQSLRLTHLPPATHASLTLPPHWGPPPETYPPPPPRLHPP